MESQETLRPLDVAVILSLAVNKAAKSSLQEIAHELGLSSSTVHQSVQRLSNAGLLVKENRRPNRVALLNFLVHGVRYAFPARLGRDARGVPTAHAGPSLRDTFQGAPALVWPDVDGEARGASLVPLYPQATGLPKNSPAVYEALTLVDAVRVGQSRERNAAVARLEQLIRGERPADG